MWLASIKTKSKELSLKCAWALFVKSLISFALGLNLSQNSTKLVNPNVSLNFWSLPSYQGTGVVSCNFSVAL